MKRRIKFVKLYYFVSCALLIVFITIAGFKIYNEFFKDMSKEVTVNKTELDALELYGYSLDDQDTDTYSLIFEELKKVLNEDDVNFEEYASVLSKLFVVDVYTLDNKITSTDIGGIEFVHPDLVDNFQINLGDNMYNIIISNVYGDRTQKLPIVSSVTVNDISDTVYTYNKVKYDGYVVDLSWEYEEDLGYQSSTSIVLIRDDNKLYIVENDGE